MPLPLLALPTGAAWLSSLFVAVWIWLLSVIPSVIIQILRVLGFASVSFIGIDLVITTVTNIIFQNFNNLSTDVLAILKIANVDTSISIILASYSAGIVVRSIVAETTRFRFFQG